MAGLAVTHASSPADIEEARRLFLEYQRWLNVDLCFQGFDEEVRTLPGRYAPPRGRLLVARDGGRAVGCVALQPLSADVCEVKRLFVRPRWRGCGVGRKLAETAIAEARRSGYHTMRLDSLKRLGHALALYRSLGCVEIPAYYDNPLTDVIYLELDLSRGLDYDGTDNGPAKGGLGGVL